MGNSELDLADALQMWEDEMNVTPIMISHPVKDYPSSYPNTLVYKTFRRFGDATTNSGFSTR